jgi:hypothetical protein
MSAAASSVLVMEERCPGAAAVTGRGSTPVEDRTQRLHRFVGEVHRLVDDLIAGGVNPIGLTVTEVAETVREMVTASDRLAGLAAMMTRHADIVDVAAHEPQGASTSIRAWLNVTTRATPGHAARMVRLGKRLDTAFEATATALLAGEVNPEQADVIVTALDRLPDSVVFEDRVRAEEHLLELAGCYDAVKLRRLARHLLHVIDPDAAEVELGRQLETEEAAAARATILVLREDSEGVCHGRFRIPALNGAMLAKYLDALANPHRPDPRERDAGATRAEEDRGRSALSRAELLGQAFCELLERFPATKLPQAGGVNATVVVTIPLETLTSGVGAGTLDTGGHLSVGAVRRLACQAGVIPAVLGSKSEVLDAGRKVRFHSPIQRTMLAVRDKGCTATGCDRPAAWCHAHHDIPFSQGGPTDLRHGRLLCPRHHTLIHSPGYQATNAGNGRVRIAKVVLRQ